MKAIHAWLALVVVLTACNSAKQTPSLQPVALPDVSRAAEPVQKQIRDRYQSLQAAIDRKAPPSELAPAFGEMGKLFMAAEYYDAAEYIRDYHEYLSLRRDQRRALAGAA